jgi:melibiose permease
MEFSKRQTAGYGLGAVGKDMVYALSASYVMYYYQDILGISEASGMIVGKKSISNNR